MFILCEVHLGKRAFSQSVHIHMNCDSHVNTENLGMGLGMRLVTHNLKVRRQS